MAANPPCACKFDAALVGAASAVVADAAEAEREVVAELCLAVALDVAELARELVAVAEPELVALDWPDVADAEPEAEDADSTVFLDSTTN